jgi:hypothetical protein
MANVELWGINEMQVTLDGSGDWTCTRDIIPTAAYLYNAAANEYVVLKQRTDAGVGMKLTCDLTEKGMIWHQGPQWPVPYKPMVDLSDSNFAGTVVVRIVHV